MYTDKRQLWCMVGRGREGGGLVVPSFGVAPSSFFGVSVVGPGYDPCPSVCLIGFECLKCKPVVWGGRS